MKYKKFIAVVLLIIVTMIPVTLMSDNRDRLTAGEIEQMEEYMDMLFYAYLMEFSNRIWPEDEYSKNAGTVNFMMKANFGQRMDRREITEELLSHYTKVVIVHSETEAAEFPDDVFVIWPSPYSRGMLTGLQIAIDERRVTNVGRFDLSPPLSYEDLVDSWRPLLRLLNRLGVTGDVALRGIKFVGREYAERAIEEEVNQNE